MPSARQLLGLKKSTKSTQSVKDQPTKPDTTGSSKTRVKKRVTTKKWLASIAPVAASDVAEHLKVFGYAAQDDTTWDDLPMDEVPEGVSRSGAWLGLGIAGHSESGGHTWYEVECSLAVEGLKTKIWTVSRRLGHLRKLWYDCIKAELGDSYKEYFDEVHFARRGGRRGTSARLDEWCSKLASCINSGQLSPVLVSLTLRFLEAPAPSLSQNSGDSPVSTDECTSGTSTRCSYGGAASSGSGASDCNDVEEDDDEYYESDFESDSESGEDQDD